jgi:Uma2 family endonuclease
MNIPTKPPLRPTPDDPPIVAIDVPVMYEDEGQEEMGETEWHTLVMEIVAYALRAHLREQPVRRVYTDMNLYYHRLDPDAYVSPDVMVCEPTVPPEDWLRSYRVGTQGPAPLLVVEVLSRRSAQQQDLTNKPWIYATLGVSEYLQLDPTGEFLPERLRLLQLEPDLTWTTCRAQGQGVVSRLGFRVIIEPSGLPRFQDASGQPYRYPSEAESHIATVEQQLAAEQRRTEELQRQLDALRRGQNTPDMPSA